jgi:phage gp36-like protein
MPYSSVDDLYKAYPKVHTVGLTPEELTVFIVRADALIDGYLGQRYAVPFASTPGATPPLIRMLSTDLAMMDVVDRWPNTPDWIIRRIERAQEVLKMIAEGIMVVVGPDGGLTDVRTDIGMIRSNTADAGYVPTFQSVPTLDERFDPNRANDERGDRGLLEE